MLRAGADHVAYELGQGPFGDGRHADDWDGRGGGREGMGGSRGPGVDHIRLPGHELGGERRQPLRPVTSEAGLQRHGLPVNVTELSEARAHAICWRIDVLRCSW